MTLPRIAIQGFEGSFHQLAAKSYFSDKIEVIPAHSFHELVTLAEDDSKTEGAIMAIENSIAGSIMPNYLMLLESQLHAVGEVYLHITQNLMTLPGGVIKNLREVHSHHMAIQQCRQFFRSYPHIHLVETEDTALSAKYVAENQLTDIGVIASASAAKLYGLEIIHPNIQTVKNNFTRFLVLSKRGNDEKADGFNKATIHFKVSHTPGSLVKTLSIISDHGLNLSKIQSFPVVQKEWQYYFHADLEFDRREQYISTIADLSDATQMLRVLGIYKRGETVL